jgi:hypothetical protein
MKNRSMLGVLVAGLIGLLILAAIIAVMSAGNVNSVSSAFVPVSPNAGSRLLPVDMPTPTVAWAIPPSEPWVKELFLQEGQIPVGWRLENTTWDGKSLGVSLGQDVTFYSTTLLAEQAYSRMLDQAFPPEYIKYWKDVPDLAFPYQADALKVACLSSKLNGVPFQACRSIARYKKLIVVTLGTVFEDKWLTMAGYRQMLEAVDRRVTEVLAQHP